MSSLLQRIATHSFWMKSYTRRNMLTMLWTFGLMFSTIEALISEEKLIHVETPGSYQQVALSEFCITPSHYQTFKFDVKAESDASTMLFTDSGTSFYQIVIGGNANRAAMIRRGNPEIFGYKQYVFLDHFLNADEYRQFWISWRDGHIKAGRGLEENDEATVFVQWIDSDPLNITSLAVYSYLKSKFIMHIQKENLMRYNRSLGQRVDVGILGVVTVTSAVDCARRCHQHVNCNHFNFRRISMKCELVGARKTDSKSDTNYDVYSQC